jgi:hypothetical protein
MRTRQLLLSLCCVALALAVSATVATAQPASISPSEHVDVTNVNNPGNAWDGNHGALRVSA